MTFPGAESPIRVVLVDPHALFRRGVRLVLDDEADIEVVGECDDGLDAVDRIVELVPDLVLMDVRLPGVSGIEAKVTPYAKQVTGWLFSQAGVVGALTLQFVLTVVIAGVMYAQGESAAAEALRFGRRLGGPRGEGAVVLAGKAIRGVALGVGVTAIVQAVVGGIGLAIAGVPFAALLTAVMFMFCIVQIGPTLVLAPAAIWVFWHGSTGWGIFLGVWTLVVGTMDNFLRPVLIKRGADLPLLLIFAGVIGGLLGFGLVGIFVGPVMLAVSYTLIDAWLKDADPPEIEVKR